MGYSLIYTPVLHFDDINGRPLVGGKLYTYGAGTNTPQETYRNAEGTEVNENPILLNERGECVAYAKDSSYKFVLKDSLDNVIWEADNVNFTASGGGGGGGTQVQADWAQTDPSAVDFIKNKPNIPAQLIVMRKVTDNTNAARYVKVAELTREISDNYAYFFDLSILFTSSTGRGDGNKNESGRFDLNFCCRRNTNVYYATGQWSNFKGDEIDSAYRHIESVILVERYTDVSAYTQAKVEVWLKVTNYLSYMQNVSASVLLNQGCYQRTSSYPTKFYVKAPWNISEGSLWFTTTAPSVDGDNDKITEFPAAVDDSEYVRLRLVYVGDETTNDEN